MTSLEAAPSPRPLWTAILQEPEASRAEEVLACIAQDLAEKAPTRSTIASGSAGVALFFAYLANVNQAHSALETCRDLLAHAVSTPVEPGFQFSFMQGRTGIAWAMAHLQSMYPRQTEDFCHEFLEAALLEYVTQKPWPGVHDHSHGLAGYGLYALERLPSAKAHALINRVVLRLEETALRLKDGVTWWTPPQTLPERQRKRFPDGGFNMGPAHGIPSIVAFLGQASRHGKAPERARRLLDEAVHWLMAQRNSTSRGGRFESFLPLTRAKPRRSIPSVVRWCYGDLGVSAALYYAALSIDETSLGRDALEIARRAARLSPSSPEVGVRDAIVCHGAAGNGHLFNRFYQATGEEIFLDAARAWFKHTLSLYTPGRGVGGFQPWHPPDELRAENADDERGLFGGAAGIGLALISALYSVEPSWDKILMASMPPRATR